MSDILNIGRSGLLTMQAALEVTGENIANVDTPGYRRKTVAFQTEQALGSDATMVSTGRVRLDRSELQLVYDPSHPLADESGHYDGSNVNLTIEIADSREAQRSYEANLRVFDQARQMSRNLFELLRR